MVPAPYPVQLGKLRRSAPINLQLPMPRILDTLATGAAGAAGAEPGDADALFGLKNVYADRQVFTACTYCCNQLLDCMTSQPPTACDRVA